MPDIVVTHITNHEGIDHTWQFVLNNLKLPTRSKLVRHCLRLADDEEMPFDYCDAAIVARITGEASKDFT